MLKNCVVLLYYTLFFGGCVCGVNGKTLIEKKKIIEIRKKHSRIYRLEFEKWKTLIFWWKQRCRETFKIMQSIQL